MPDNGQDSRPEAGYPSLSSNLPPIPPTSAIQIAPGGGETPPALPDYLHLSLSSRYQAAWGEHSTRIAQRQTVLQIYLAAAALIYSAWYANFLKGSQSKEPFLVIAITVLTLGSAVLILTHNIVIHNLTTFLRRCEEYAYKDIYRCEGFDLFYFFKPGDKSGLDVHKDLRLATRFILFFMLAVTNGFAVVLDWDHFSMNGKWWQSPWIYIVVGSVSAIVTLGDLIYDCPEELKAVFTPVRMGAKKFEQLFRKKNRLNNSPKADS